jgi:hypothetical protein
MEHAVLSRGASPDDHIGYGSALGVLAEGSLTDAKELGSFPHGQKTFKRPDHNFLNHP